MIFCSIWNVYRYKRASTCLRLQWAAGGSVASVCRVSSAGLSSSQPPVVQKHTTAVPRIRHIFLCYFHINSAAPSCLSFLSRSNLNTSLHFQTRCCGLALSEGAAFFFTFLWEWKGSTDTSSLPAISPFSCLPPLLVSVMVQLRLKMKPWREGAYKTCNTAAQCTQVQTCRQSDQHLRHSIMKVLVDLSCDSDILMNTFQ